MAAAEGPVRELSEELTCPICLEYFIDPVILPECAHSFCRDCLTCSWGEAAAMASCPMCKQTSRPGDLRPNRQLANIVEIAKKLNLQGGEAEERICEKHRKPLKLFCQTDEILICRVCDKSTEHKSHEVIPAEEAAQKYKDKIFSCLETLRTEREKILVYLADAEDESQEILNITESERKKTVAEFRTLRQLLEEQEKHLLAQIEEVEKEVARKRDDHLAKLSEELSSLESLIQEMEEKHQQPVSELLQDVRSSLQRCKEKENFENPLAFSSDLQQRLQSCCNIGPFLGGIMKQFKGQDLTSLWAGYPDTLAFDLRMQKAKVTLGPTPADSKLILSEDRRSIKCHSKAEERPEDPENIYLFSNTYGSEGFTAGWHFWEVLVGCEDGWAVGVASKPVKGRFIFTPEEGIWVVGRSQGRYKAFIRGINPPLTLCGELKRIRVSLNYDGGQVAFFDADRAALLYRFSGASFSGETLRPFFAVYDKGYLRLCP
ncbi:UNVERIFIED_CONTAM: hypothetical protein K2H54_061110 [Gekko kuhli]